MPALDHPIDLTTMLFVNALTSFATALLFLGFWWATDYLKRPDSLLYWSAGYGLLTIGFLLLSSNIVGLVLPRIDLIANLMIDAGMALSLVATNRLLDRPARDNWPVVLAGCLAIGEVAYAVSQPVRVPGVMLLLGVAIRGMLTTAIGVALWRHAEPAHRAPARMAAMFHFAWAAMLALRLAPVLFEVQGLPTMEVIVSLALIARLLLTWTIGICLLWMIARQLNERVIRHATRDMLTDLSNRRVMWEAGTRRIAARDRGGTDVALVLLDIDHFKQVNDRWGHPAGDQVLTMVADRIRAAVRPDDLVGRVGGEEFMVLLAPTSPVSTIEIAERIRSAVERTPFALPDGREIRCTISVGCSGAGTSCPSWEKLIAQADVALYAAKDGGRNRVVDHATLAKAA